MPYERDTDHVTRGVGAIAAADHVSPARHRRRVRIGRALRKRDRAMARIAQGALGLVTTDGSSSGGSTSSSASGTRTVRLPSAKLVPVRVSVPGLVIDKPPSKPPSTYTPVYPKPPPLPPPSPPIIAPPGAPKPVAVVPVAPVTVSSGSSPPLIKPGTIAPPTVSTPDLPDIPEGSQDDHTNRNIILIAAGAGALAYFLFFRRRA